MSWDENKKLSGKAIEMSKHNNQRKTEDGAV